jgi:endonuclease V-like protein UPF0215 family
VKAGRRALGIAESYRGTDDGATSTLGGAVVRANRAVDDFGLATCTVGGRDATDAVVDLWDRLDRPDVRYVFLAGVAPAWYNLLDLDALAAATDRPVLAVSFEESDGLDSAIENAFDGDERAARLDAYRSLPERFRLSADGAPLFIRCVGLDESDAKTVVEAYTHERRPEPLRVARALARRIDAARRDGRLVSE